MAILTASGRAALAAAIKQQTLHLALEDSTLYVLDGDYGVNAREGTLTRLGAGRIQPGQMLNIRFRLGHPCQPLSA